MAVLRIHAPVLGREERVLELPDGHPVTIGRDEACDVVLLEQAASRHHARLERQGDALHLVDLGSANGVWVGDERVEGSRVLHDGEVVRIGDTTLTLVLDPYRQPTLHRRERAASGEVEGAAAAEPSAAEAEAEVPSPPPASEAPEPVPPALVAPRPAAPLSAARSPSAYSIGSEPTLAAQSGPNILGIHERSAPSTYSLGSEPTLAAESGPNILGTHERSAPSTYSIGEAPAPGPRAEPSGPRLASSASVYSLGDEPVAPREPAAFGLPRPSSASVYSLGDEPVAPSREPASFGPPRPSSASVYSLGDEPVAALRGPDVRPSAPALDGATSSAALGAPPPPPGVAAPLPPPPRAPVEPQPRPPAFVVPPPAHSAASSWEWSEPLPAEQRRRHHPAGPTLWLGLGLLIGGVIAMIVALAAGYHPGELVGASLHVGGHP